MKEWKNSKAVVYEDRHGNTRCGACCTPLWCNDCGDMPETCPQCGAPLDYSIYRPEESRSAMENGKDLAAEILRQAPEIPKQDIPAPVKYFPIDEEVARRAHEMTSTRDYPKNRATIEYRAAVDAAVEIAEKRKAVTSPYYHDKIDELLQRYARRLADWTNAYNRNGASCPSVLISGASNFPTRKKQKQNAREDSLWREYEEIKGILEKLKSVGTGPVDLADPNAREILSQRLESYKKELETAKAINAHYRKFKTFRGFPGMSDEKAEKLDKEFSDSQARVPYLRQPYQDFELASLRGKIERTQSRLSELEKLEEARKSQPQAEEHNGVQIVRNAELCRLQIIFPGKPDGETIENLKKNGFRWSPKNMAWQRQLTPNAERALVALGLNK